MASKLNNPPFADDLLLFAYSHEEVGIMLDLLVVSLSRDGLQLNASKAKVLTIRRDTTHYFGKEKEGNIGIAGMNK